MIIKLQYRFSHFFLQARNRNCKHTYLLFYNVWGCVKMKRTTHNLPNNFELRVLRETFLKLQKVHMFLVTYIRVKYPPFYFGQLLYHFVTKKSNEVRERFIANVVGTSGFIPFYFLLHLHHKYTKAAIMIRKSTLVMMKKQEFLM